MQAKHAFANRSESLPSQSATPEQNQQTADEAARAAYSLGLRQKMRTFRQLWRICDQRVCKRARKCCASYVFCEKYDFARMAERAKRNKKS